MYLLSTFLIRKPMSVMSPCKEKLSNNNNKKKKKKREFIIWLIGVLAAVDPNPTDGSCEEGASTFPHRVGPTNYAMGG